MVMIITSLYNLMCINFFFLVLKWCFLFGSFEERELTKCVVRLRMSKDQSKMLTYFTKQVWVRSQHGQSSGTGSGLSEVGQEVCGRFPECRKAVGHSGQ